MKGKYHGDEEYTLPFEDIFGDTPELRVIEALMATSSPTGSLEFTWEDLMELCDLAENDLYKIEKLVEWGVISARPNNEETLYRMDHGTEFTQTFMYLNNLIIEKILKGLGDE